MPIDLCIIPIAGEMEIKHGGKRSALPLNQYGTYMKRSSREITQSVGKGGISGKTHPSTLRAGLEITSIASHSPLLSLHTRKILPPQAQT